MMTLTRQTPTKQKQPQLPYTEHHYASKRPAMSSEYADSMGAGSGSWKDRDTSSIPCKFFRNGKCSAGWDCVFSHQIDGHHNFLLHQSLEQSSGGILNVCKFFLKGACRFGSKCALLHVFPDSTEFFDLNTSNSSTSGSNLASASQTPPPLSSNMPSLPRVPTAKLPSPKSMKNPAAPLPIRRNSMADLFRWSADQWSEQPTGNFLFYSSSLTRQPDEKEEREDKGGNGSSSSSISSNEGAARELAEPQRPSFINRARSVSETPLLSAAMPKGNKPTTPDPFSPFPEDYSDDTDDTAVGALVAAATSSFNQSTLTGFPMDLSEESLEESFYYDAVNDMSFTEMPLDGGDDYQQQYGVYERPTAVNLLHQQQMPLPDFSELRCELCRNQVMAKGKFGITACDHCFCLSCIRSLRASRISAGMTAAEIQQCPLNCPVLTPFIVPSFFWITNARQKQLIFMDYQMKISNIPCKFYNFGENACPFGKECYYLHTTQRPIGGAGVEESSIILGNAPQHESMGRPRAATLSDFFSGGGGGKSRRPRK